MTTVATTEPTGIIEKMYNRPCPGCDKHPMAKTAGWLRDANGQRIACRECNPDSREHNVWCGLCYPEGNQ
jgi:hypothetical protein